MELSAEGTTWRVLSVPAYGYHEYGGRRVLVYYDANKFGDVAPESDCEHEHVPLGKTAVVCGLKLEPKDLAPRTQTRSNIKSSKGARLSAAPTTVYVGSLVALGFFIF